MTGEPQHAEPDDAEHAARIAWVSRVRNLHRNKRQAALIGCAAAIGLMLWGRFADGPAWAVPAGLVVVALSWALFAFIMFDRFRWVKANPYEPTER